MRTSTDARCSLPTASTAIAVRVTPAPFPSGTSAAVNCAPLTMAATPLMVTRTGDASLTEPMTVTVAALVVVPATGCSIATSGFVVSTRNAADAVVALPGSIVTGDPFTVTVTGAPSDTDPATRMVR